MTRATYYKKPEDYSEINSQTWTFHKKLRPTSFPEMSKNLLITVKLMIPSYRQILLLQIQRSSIILSFDPLTFELKPFHWYVTVCHRL
jgi:hypothetical protein